MRRIAGMMTAATLIATPVSAQAADLCSTLKAAIKVAMTDKQFASLQVKPLNGRESSLFDEVTSPSKLQIPGMTCEISIEEGRGYHSCIIKGLTDVKVERAKLVAQVDKCLGKKPDPATKSNSTIYTVRANPKLIVSISGELKAAYLNIIAW